MDVVQWVGYSLFYLLRAMRSHSTPVFASYRKRLSTSYWKRLCLEIFSGLIIWTSQRAIRRGENESRRINTRDVMG